MIRLAAGAVGFRKQLMPHREASPFPSARRIHETSDLRLAADGIQLLSA
jgi:hypothetical protein